MWRRLHAAAKAMTPFKRGVATSAVAAGMIAEAVKSRAIGKTRRPCARDEKPPSHIYLQRPTEKREGRLARTRSAWDVSGEGEHPALGPVPFPVPPGEVSRLRFASLRTGFAAAPNLRDLVCDDYAFLFRLANQFVDILRQPPLDLTAACRSCQRSERRESRLRIQSRRGRSPVPLIPGTC